MAGPQGDDWMALAGYYVSLAEIDTANRPAHIQQARTALAQPGISDAPGQIAALELRLTELERTANPATVARDENRTIDRGELSPRTGRADGSIIHGPEEIAEVIKQTCQLRERQKKCEEEFNSCLFAQTNVTMETCKRRIHKDFPKI